MRTLTATQLAAQASLATTPVVRLTLRPASAGEDRYAFPSPTAWQFPSVILGASPIAIAAADGIMRPFAILSGSVRTTSFTGTPPSQGATSTLAATTDSLIAAAAAHNTLAYATTAWASTTVTVNVFYSGTWHAETLTTTIANVAIALAWSGDGRLLILCVQSTTRIAAYIRTAPNTFSTAFVLTPPPYTFSAPANFPTIAAAYSNPGGAAGSGDWAITYALLHATTSDVATVLLGDGHLQAAGTYSTPAIAHTATSPTATSPGTLFFVGGITVADSIRWTVFEHFTNTPALLDVQHTYLQSALSLSDLQAGYHREPIPVDTPEADVLRTAVDASTSRFWLLDQTTFTYADPPTTTDLSARVLTAQTVEDESKATCNLLLDNSDGGLSALLSPGSIGQRLSVAFGYQTSAGAEYSFGRPHWLSALHGVAHSGANLLDLHGSDAWHLLAAYKPRRTKLFAVNTLTIAQLIQWILARAGLPFTPPASPSTILQTKPAFALQPSTTGAHAVHALLDQVPEVLLFNQAGGKLALPLAADAAAYTYTPAAHQALGGRRTVLPQGLNHVQLMGNATATATTPTLIADSLDSADAALLGDSQLVLLDRQVSLGNAQLRSDTALRKQQMIQDTGEIAAVPNIGLELWDQLSITYSALGWSASKQRVRAIHTDLNFVADGGQFSQSIGLQNP